MGSKSRPSASRVSVGIAAATAADVAAVVRIEKVCFSEPWSEESFRSLVDGAHARFRVAVNPDHSIAGYIAAIALGDDAELLNVAVEPGSRRQGIAARLLDSVVAELRTKRLKTLYLEVRESNLAAIALYKSRGFRQLGVRRNYYRRPAENALVLALDLAPE